MNIQNFQADVAARMVAGTDETIHPESQFVRTCNGYWIAWHEGEAAVLADNTPAGEPCDWVEGASELAEIVELIESGEYEAMLNFEGNDGDWEQLESGCGCGCAHGDHQH